MLVKYEWKSPVGELILASHDGKLCLADWKYRKMRSSIDLRIQNYYQSEFKQGNSEIIENTISQLEQYFRKERMDFELPLEVIGTAFQQSVWKALMAIPYGQTMSYLGLSQTLGDPKAIRAVATANGANAISIIIPCHRIIGSNGDMTGYAGGISVKKKLINLESSTIQLSLF